MVPVAKEELIMNASGLEISSAVSFKKFGGRSSILEDLFRFSIFRERHTCRCVTERNENFCVVRIGIFSDCIQMKLRIGWSDRRSLEAIFVKKLPRPLAISLLSVMITPLDLNEEVLLCDFGLLGKIFLATSRKL